MALRVKGSEIGFKTFSSCELDKECSIECSICGYLLKDESDEQFKKDNQYIEEKYGYKSLIKVYDFKKKAEVCSHISHTLCLYRWVMISKKITCPVCRAGGDLEVNLRPLVNNIETIRKFRKNGALFKKYYKVSGLRIGNYKSYYRNGRVRELRNYNIRGKIHGDYNIWWKNGTPCVNATFKHNKPHNTLREFHPNGELKASVRFMYGKKHGWSKMFDTNGRLRLSEKFIMDYRYGVRNKYKDGVKVYSAYYKYGLKNGPKWEWYENGNKKVVAFYVSGSLNGPYIQYHKDGTMHVLTSYRLGKINDYYYEYHSNGNLKYETKIKIEKGEIRDCIVYNYYSEDGKLLYGLSNLKYLELPSYIRFQLEYYLPLFCKKCKNHLVISDLMIDGNAMVLKAICKNCTKIKNLTKGAFCNKCGLMKATKFNYCEDCEEYDCGCEDSIESFCYICEGCNVCGGYIYGRYCGSCEYLAGACDCDDPFFFPICLKCHNKRVKNTYRTVKIEVI